MDDFQHHAEAHAVVSNYQQEHATRDGRLCWTYVEELSSLPPTTTPVFHVLQLHKLQFSKFLATLREPSARALEFSRT